MYGPLGTAAGSKQSTPPRETRKHELLPGPAWLPRLRGTAARSSSPSLSAQRWHRLSQGHGLVIRGLGPGPGLCPPFPQSLFLHLFNGDNKTVSGTACNGFR